MNSTRTEQRTPTSDWLTAFLVCLLFPFVGLFLVVEGINQLRLGSKSSHWPAAEGRIISSRIFLSSHREIGGGKSGARSTTYSVQVRYSYEVDDQTFEGSRLSYGEEGHSNRSEAQKVLARYPQGKEVEVYYDPMDPKRSVLVRGPGMSWLVLVMGAMFFVVGLPVSFIFGYCWLSSRKSEAS